MKVKRKFAAFVGALCISASLLTPTVFASNKYSFYLTNTDTTTAAYKNDTTAADVYPKAGNSNLSKYGLKFTIQAPKGTTVSESRSRYNLNHFDIEYKKGKAIRGKKFLHSQKAAISPGKSVSMNGVWYP